MRVFRFTVMFDAPGDPGPGGGSPAPAPAPASSPAAAPSPTPSPAPSGSPAPAPAGGAPGSAAARRFEYEQEFGGRSNWIPPHRLSEVAAERDRLMAMLEAGTGVRIRPEAHESPEVLEARNTLFQLIPGLKETLEFMQENREGLQGVMAQAPQFAAGSAHVWNRHGATVLGELHREVAKDLGVETIEPNSKQARILGRSFMAWLEDDPQNQEAYVNQPPAQVVGAFLADMRAGLFDPIRRVAQAGSLMTGNRNATLPRPAAGGAPAGAGGGTQKPTEDEIYSNAFKHMQQVIAGHRR